jgi:rhodanese-related sulfurtransferase
VEVCTGARVTGAVSDGAGVAVRVGADVREFDAAVAALGVTANNAFAQEAGLALGASGGLVVGDDLSCAPGVWACGDCVEVTHRVTGTPQLPGRSGLAGRMGRVVAERMAGLDARFGPVVGSFAVRIGEVVVAATGVTAAAARAAGLSAQVVWGSFPDRAILDPERRYDTVALVSEAGTGRLLGLQAVGPGAPVRRADQLATQLRAGAHLHDLMELEPCCHPAVGDLLDPLYHLAAITVAAAVGGPQAVASELGIAGAVLLDVREASELAGDWPPIPEALNIPLGELEGRLGEIPRDRPVVVYCARGPRSYEAVARLTSWGFINIYYLAGGVGLRSSR